MTFPISILDLAPIRPGETATDSFAASVALAQLAEAHGYRRVWYAEHHNFPSIASSAPAVVIAHVGAFTRTIRLGAGGIMLPNHAPLMVAEQFGTLAALYPGRIDLGLGRAPGTDQETMFALRRYVTAADRFPEDVRELQGFLTGNSQIPGVDATPGNGSNVPLYILGSSLFGAELAARLGLPYGFASHFAPDHLVEAVAAYREEFRPSAQLDEPYVIAGVNVLAAGTSAEAQEHLLATRRFRVASLLARGRVVSDQEADELLRSRAGQHVEHMLSLSAVGSPAEVREYLVGFKAHANADELITAHQAPTAEARLRSVALLADCMDLDKALA